MRRAFTLLELLVSVAIVGVLMGGLATAYVASIDQDARVRQGRDESLNLQAFEDRVSDLFRHAYLSLDAADTSTYFIAVDDGGGATRVTFSTLGQRIPQIVIDSQDDFETLNERHGPQGGVTEVSIGTTPIGAAPSPNGLFLREQRPADGDPEQGGYESQLNEQIQSCSFEFWDGTQWIADWDTREQTERRLPAAVRMTYRFENEENDRVFTFRIPASDITDDNPLVQSGGTTG